MSRIPELFLLLQTTRAQPLYGYALSGNRDPSNLAEHHYLVTMIAWQLATSVRDAGMSINIEKVLELSLFHDLGELFGGDIAMPYARANHKAKELAKAFEIENQDYLLRFFEENKEQVKKCFQEALNATTDEARIMKLADYIEITCYKKFINQFSEEDIRLVDPKLNKMIQEFDNIQMKEHMEAVIQDWLGFLRTSPSFDETMKKILV